MFVEIKHLSPEGEHQFWFQELQHQILKKGCKSKQYLVLYLEIGTQSPEIFSQLRKLLQCITSRLPIKQL